MKKHPESVDLLILDKYMPKMCVEEVMRNMKTISKLKDVPVIIETSETDEEKLEECRKEGAVDILIRPFEPEELVYSVHKVLKSMV